MQPNIQTTFARDARIAGALYVAALPIGCVRPVYVQFTLLAGSFGAGHAAATAARIVDNEMIFRRGMPGGMYAAAVFTLRPRRRDCGRHAWRDRGPGRRDEAERRQCRRVPQSRRSRC